MRTRPRPTTATPVTLTTAEIVTPHLLALAPAAVGLCCLAADRRRARVREVAAGLVMMIAMIDSAVGHLVPLVWWVALLLATAMALAASHRRSRLAHGAGSGPVRGTEATMVAHAAGGMVVMAALLLAMATGGAAAGAWPGVGVAAHAHGGSGVGASAAEIGVLGVTLAGVYVVASLVVIARSRSPLDRGQYAAMAASAGLMAWGLVL